MIILVLPEVTIRIAFCIIANYYSFVFNVCRNVVAIPRDSTGGKGCEKTVHDQDEEGHDIMDDSIVPAFLVSKSDATCNRVSSSIEKGNVDFKLYGHFYIKL